jgi:hypothetical protein
VQTDLLFRLGAQPTAFEVMSEAPSTQAVLECVRKVLRPSCVPSCHPAQAAAVSSDPVRWKTSDCPEGLCGGRSSGCRQGGLSLGEGSRDRTGPLRAQTSPTNSPAATSRSGRLQCSSNGNASLRERM